MRFGALVDRLVPPGALRDAIRALLEEKRAGAELDRGPRIEPISAFIEAELLRLETALGALSPAQPDVATLDTFFLRALAILWPENATATPGLHTVEPA